MRIVQARQAFPDTWERSLFLVGPSPRGGQRHHSWRPIAIDMLQDLQYDGVVFNPEPMDGLDPDEYGAQVKWECQGLEYADGIVAWVPRNLVSLPAFTTNVEFGWWMTSGKPQALGYPIGAPKMRYLHAHAERLGIPVYHTLDETLQSVIDQIGPGQQRTRAERAIPLHIWRRPEWQHWYRTQVAAGNLLIDAQVQWVYRVGRARHVFCWALWVDVYVTAERRHKLNEFIFGRPDIAAVVLYHRGQSILDTQVALIREFRSPAVTPDGYIHEVPSGSSLTRPDITPEQLAYDELREETGIVLGPGQLQPIGVQQLAGTLSVHRAHTFAAELTIDQWATVQALAESGREMGEPGGEERTRIETMTVADLISNRVPVDWANRGMILQTIMAALLRP